MLESLGGESPEGAVRRGMPGSRRRRTWGTAGVRNPARGEAASVVETTAQTTPVQAKEQQHPC